MKGHSFRSVIAMLLVLTGLFTLLSRHMALAADSSGALARRAASLVLVSGAGGGGYPVGSLLIWPHHGQPEGWSEGLWMECDGRAVNPVAYPELAALLAPMGGRVPDLRGLFLRGVGGNAAALGQVQGDGVKLPDQGGSFAGRANAGAVVAWSNPYTGVFQQSGEVVIRAMGRGWDYDEVWNRVVFNLANASTAPETRPVNRAVRYLIRAKP